MTNSSIEEDVGCRHTDFPVSIVLFSELERQPVILGLTIAAGFMCIATVVLYFVTLRFLYSHRRLEGIKINKYKVIVMLGLYPLVSCVCMLSLLLPRTTMIAELMIAMYMAVCILMFVRMVVDYMGGFKAVCKEMEGEQMSFRTPPCCCCCCCPGVYKQKVNSTNLKRVNLMTLQGAFVRPIITIVALILWADKRYILGEDMSPSAASLYLNLIGAVSSLVAMWAMMVTFRSLRSQLQDYNVGKKFAALQLTIVVVNIQGFLFQILAKYNIPECVRALSSTVRAYRSNYFILIIEMLLLMIFARIAFKRKEESYKATTREIQEKLKPAD
ncbi:organic solute transporter subunit alpha-like isoform X2 [Crassostrea angulata]|uniref:organic solute transporter subunit alpha-like isoform X2 n=1 Tax=Magallana angulata TaxID=2784310 RepID=UPI0022B18022|nr:organic solute transporter subunit alpha-like isoform X2 [Crassostrea angulata]XP_052685427.1 organic solute transporter subunit alpha-like isoform X2 [Crassostrea angulata]